MRRSHLHGFTLIELLVVMVLIAMLLSIALPKYIGNVDRSKEAVLREDLSSLRDLIDKHYADTGKYPMALQDLVTHHYLRKVPVDPMTDSDRTWVVVPPGDPNKGAVFDIHSGSSAKARDGTYFRDW